MNPVGIVTVILAKAGEYLVAPIGNQLSYFHGYNTNIENFRKQLEKLCDSRTCIQQSVNAATRNGEEIKAGVQKWLRNADLMIAEAEEFDGKIRLINRRCFNGWCPDWRSRYKLSKEAVNKTAIMAELHGDGQMENVSLPAPPPGIEFISGKDFVTVESSKSTIDQIVVALQDVDCDIVGVYGMGGIGKTTLVKEVGKRVKGLGLFDQVVMAVVSQTPNLRKIQGQIADMLGLKFSEESEIGRAGRLYERLKNEERILIILDDVWTNIELVNVGIPHGDDHKGCKILLTTRRESVCSAMGIRVKKFEVHLLSAEESWNLFRKNAGTIVDASKLIGVAMEVSSECRGLPLALVTVGRALRDKGLKEWKTALQQLKKSKPLNIDYLELDHVFSCLKLSYDYLKSEEIKLCFLFCCLFAEDHDIKIEDLARYGMGKWLFRDAETIEEARKQAHFIIGYLKASCLLLDSDKEGCIKIHDMVRDFAISVASEHNHGFLVRAGVGLKEWPKRETFEHNTIISLMDNNILELPQGLECPKLQILLLGENEGFDVIPDAFFQGMMALKVLDLSERIGVHSLLPVFPGASHRPRILTLPSSLKSLANLQTLHLDHCRLGNISLLGKLKKLEILSFFGSDIKELPMEIRELINLRLLDLSFCQNLKTIPANVLSRLLHLEELYMGGSFREWEGKGRSNACLGELQSLSHLSILCVELQHMDFFPENLFLPNLAKFEITIGYNSMNCYPISRTLYLRNIETALVDGVKALFGTTEDLTLNCATKGSKNFLPDIDQEGLNGLKTLKVIGADEMIHLIDTARWNPPVIFAALEELQLRILDGMPVICSGLLPPGSFQKLRILTVEWCSVLWYIVSDNLLPRLQNLEEVAVYNCRNVHAIFKTEGNTCKEEHSLLLSCLKILRLESLFNLRYICKGSIRNVSFANLTVVEIKHCQNIAYLFSTSMARSMLQLETLKIESCIKMVAIVPNVETGVGFPNLKEVQVRRCLEMRSLFSVSVNNAQGGGEGVEKKNIILAQLNRLQLIDMPVLERLCPTDYSVELPSLKELVVEKCPTMKNFADFGFEGMPSAVKIQVDKEIVTDIHLSRM